MVCRNFHTRQIRKCCTDGHENGHKIGEQIRSILKLILIDQMPKALRSVLLVPGLIHLGLVTDQMPKALRSVLLVPGLIHLGLVDW